MSESTGELESNPLLKTSGLPPFDEIKPEHVAPAVRQVLQQAEDQMQMLEKSLKPTWEGLLQPLEEMDLPFEYAWSPVGHLLGVKNSEALRKAHESALSEMVAFGLRAQQSKPVYDGLKAIREGEEWDRLDSAQQRVVEQKLRQAKNSGVGLEGEAKERFNEIAKELSQISTDFSNHVLDATKAFELIVTDKKDTDGWPNSLLQVAAQSYNQNTKEADSEATPEEGPWRITLDFPSYYPFMQHSRVRGQREKLYRAYVTRASDGEFDNTELIDRTLKLRSERARLLGFDTFADLSLDAKMAPDVAAVERMFKELSTASRLPQEKDYETLKELSNGETRPLAHWDVEFWSERWREKKFDYTDDELRPYFPMPRVLDGLFGLCTRIFGIRIEPADGEAPIWHDDVRYFKVYDENGSAIASFYLDPFSRPEEKRGGAWAGGCLGRRWIDQELILPVAHLCCNGTPPVGEKPSLMSFSEVETLYHEFGHGLQGMLTTVDRADVAGLSGVEWDAVELASQFMENWCYHRPTLMGMTEHVDTGDPLPEDLFEKICAARTFRAGSSMMRQLIFGMTDMALHCGFDPDGDQTVFEVERKIMLQNSVLEPLAESRFLCGFGHIFAGGYAAGYYSYKWSEVLSADAFSAFEEVGLDNKEAVASLGRKFRDTVLALGGSQHPMAVFKTFRGREPTTEALLRHSDLIKS